MSERMSAAEYRKAYPEADHSDKPSRVTAAEYNGTVGKAWDRPLVGDELTNEVHGFMPRVIRAFRENGCECQYHTTDPRKCRAGFPDLVICHEGLLVVAELKVGKNKPDPEQRKWLDHFVSCEVHGVFVWYPSDWECIVEVASGRLDRYRGDVWYDEPSRWVNRRVDK